MIRKRTIITFSLLLSFIGAFLLQFSQMTSLCYYGIYPLACLLAFICFNKIQKIEKSIVSISGTVLVAFFATSFIFGTVQGTSMGVLYWLPYVYLALILIFISPEYWSTPLKIIFSTCIFIGVIQTIGIILQVFQHDLWESIVRMYMTNGQIQELAKREFDGYFSGFSTEVAVSAFYIAFLVLISFFRNWFSKRWMNLSTIYILIGTYTIVLTSKRAHLLFLLCSIIITAIISNTDMNILRRWGKYIVSIFIGIISILFVIQYASEESSIGRIIGLFEGIAGGQKSLDELSTGRMSLWLLAIDLFSKNPIVGIGWCNFYKHNIFQYHAHNTYLQVLCETGIVGFVFYISFIILTMAFSVKTIRKCVILGKRDYLQVICPGFGMQCFYLFYSITGNTLYDYWYFWAYCICVVLSSYVGAKLKEYYLSDCETKNGINADNS